MSTNRCAKCGSDKVVPNARLFDQGQYSDGTLKAAFEQNPAAWFFKGRVLGELRVTICGACGYTELFVENPQAIYEAYRREDWDEKCLRCGAATLPDVQTCPSCGWSYPEEQR